MIRRPPRSTLFPTRRSSDLADGFDVMVTGFPALDHDVRTISAEDSERGEQRVLPLTLVVLIVAFGALVAAMVPIVVGVLAITIALGLVTIAAKYLRSEERRVGKECRSRWSPYH